MSSIERAMGESGHRASKRKLPRRAVRLLGVDRVDLPGAGVRVASITLRRLGEQRRYFPDWTHRLLESGRELEADRNSYLAGGYAEEFGYGAQTGSPRGVPVLDREPPELRGEWSCQAGGIHPGYPLRAHPFPSDFDSALEEPVASAAAVHAFDPHPSMDTTSDARPHGGFIVVSHLPYRRATARRAAVISTLLTAALVRLQWALRRRH